MSNAHTRPSVRQSVAVAAAVIAVTAAPTLAVLTAPSAVAALIVEGSSTNQSGAGIRNFYGGKFDVTPDTDLVEVNFLTGPFGIWHALDQHRSDADGAAGNVVMSSGWGAANASLLLSYLQATGSDDAMLSSTTWVLDNNVANPNGGFGTRYPVFALIGVNPIPTPADTGAVVISTAYEYDINGNAPKYIANPFADANSLAAYFNRRLTQAELPMPVNADGSLEVPEGEVDRDGNPVADCTSTCTFSYDGGTVVRVTQTGGVTYVGYQTQHLPLVQPLYDHGGPAGEKLAQAVEPALTALVNYGYPDNDPLANPGTLERAALLPSARETKTFLKAFTAGVRTGAATLNAPQSPPDPDTADAPPRTSSTLRTKADLDAVRQTGSDALRTGPIRNVLRTAPKFHPGVRDTGDRLTKPAELKPISAKDAVQRLTKVFTPKTRATSTTRPDNTTRPDSTTRPDAGHDGSSAGAQ